MSFDKIIASLLVVVFLSQYASAKREGFEWQEVSPEAEGMSPHKLDEAREILAGKGP
jgi:hypothetical protein